MTLCVKWSFKNPCHTPYLWVGRSMLKYSIPVPAAYWTTSLSITKRPNMFVWCTLVTSWLKAVIACPSREEVAKLLLVRLVLKYFAVLVCEY